MSQWVLYGLKTGIKSTSYPDVNEKTPGISPGKPVRTKLAEGETEELSKLCPTNALEAAGDEVAVDLKHCIHCFRCTREGKMQWDLSYEWARMTENGNPTERKLPRWFSRSLNVFVIDVGDCGACLNEVKQLNNPYYNFHRLGFFFTPSPRHADILLVVGALTEHMRVPLQKAYEAMPAPKRVVAVGACAISGGIFGQSFAIAGSIGEFLPVDVEVPGNPPPPLAIIHGLLLVTNRKSQTKSETSAASSDSSDPTARNETTMARLGSHHA